MKVEPERTASSRQTKRTLMVVVCLYVVIGFVVAVVSAVAGQPIGAFLGFLIISGSLAASVVLNGVLRVSHELASLREQLETIGHGMAAWTSEAGRSAAPDAGEENSAITLDLASLGPGDPGPITAATLDVSTFPRLLRAERDSAEDRRHELCRQIAALDASALEGIPAPQDAVPADGGAGEPWPEERHPNETVERPSAVTLRPELRSVEDELEESLRVRFSRSIRAADFAAALAIGEQICAHLPDRPVADDFRRIRPHLLRRIARQAPARLEPRSYAQR